MLKKHKLISSTIPKCLRTVPSPPKELFIIGDLDELLARPRLAVIGSRKVTPYGHTVTERIVQQTAQAGIVIVSGLALGVDSIAHRAALSVGGLTAAILPSGLDKIYPASHTALAREIVKCGGMLMSEYGDGMVPYKTNFVARNRLVSGLADALLVTEAAEKSGTLHTVNFALEQGRPVLAVPGNITSPQSQGTNNLIKSGAMPVTSAQDVFDALGISKPKSKEEIIANTPEEHRILSLMREGICDGHELLVQSELSAAIFNQTLTMLEITGRIKALGGNQWSKM